MLGKVINIQLMKNTFEIHYYSITEWFSGIFFNIKYEMLIKKACAWWFSVFCMISRIEKVAMSQRKHRTNIWLALKYAEKETSGFFGCSGKPYSSAEMNWNHDNRSRMFQIHTSLNISEKFISVIFKVSCEGTYNILSKWYDLCSFNFPQ